MIERLTGKLKNSPLVKKYLEPIITNAIEDNFNFDNNITGTFKDSFGREYELYRGLRSKLKPDWQTMLNPEKSRVLPSNKELKASLPSSKRQIQNFKRTIKSFGTDLNNKEILEIGCFNGMKTFLLGCDNINSLTGSDVAFYYENKPTDKNNELIDSYLSSYRNKVLNLFDDKDKNSINKKVKFVKDNISKSSLPNDSYDIVASWETLEHIIDIEAAFHHIRRILKPTGIAFHEYNPFYSLNGGHSLCTLDFPWGHCRLNENDFLRYVREIRLAEYEPASNFYLNSLNRMTIDDLKETSKNAGLEIKALIPFVKKAHLVVYTNSSYEETKQHYQSAEPIDLIAPVVWVVHQKI